MNTFVGACPFSKIALCVAKETIQSHITKMDLFLRTIFFAFIIISGLIELCDICTKLI